MASPGKSSRGRSKRDVRIIGWGGLGDAVLATPCYRAIKTADPDVRLLLFWTHPFHEAVFRHNPYIDVLKPARFTAAPIEFLRYLAKRTDYHLAEYSRLNPGLFSTRHATETIAEMLGITVTDMKPDIFLTREEEAKARDLLSRYATPVAMHITSRCSANQNWPVEHWETLVRDNPALTFLQLGLDDEPPVAGAVDLRGRTTVREAFAIVKHARSFVGIDSAMQNATAAFGTPGVVLYAPSSPAVWGHPNNINLYNDREPCAPCINVLRTEACPYGTPCMRAITPAAVTEALRAQLAKAEARLHTC